MAGLKKGDVVEYLAAGKGDEKPLRAEVVAVRATLLVEGDEGQTHEQQNVLFVAEGQEHPAHGFCRLRPVAPENPRTQALPQEREGPPPGRRR